MGGDSDSDSDMLPTRPTPCDLPPSTLQATSTDDVRVGIVPRGHCSTVQTQPSVWHSTAFCSMQHAATPEAPIDIILRGKLRSGEQVGLALKSNYEVRVIEVNSKAIGLPQSRGRVYILMFRRDVEVVVVDYMMHVIRVVFQGVHVRATTWAICAFASSGFAPSPQAQCAQQAFRRIGNLIGCAHAAGPEPRGSGTMIGSCCCCCCWWWWG